MEDYEEIMYLKSPKSKNHPPMPRKNRAAQFAPFAALPGYHEGIEEDARYVEKKIQLSQEAKEDLDKRLSIIRDFSHGDKSLTLVYFCPDEKKLGGKYKKISGKLEGINRSYLTLEGGQKISLDLILELDSEILSSLDWD